MANRRRRFRRGRARRATPGRTAKSAARDEACRFRSWRGGRSRARAKGGVRPELMCLFTLRTYCQTFGPNLRFRAPAEKKKRHSGNRGCRRFMSPATRKKRARSPRSLARLDPLPHDLPLLRGALRDARAEEVSSTPVGFVGGSERRRRRRVASARRLHLGLQNREVLVQDGEQRGENRSPYPLRAGVVVRAEDPEPSLAPDRADESARLAPRPRGGGERRQRVPPRRARARQRLDGGAVAFAEGTRARSPPPSRAPRRPAAPRPGRPYRPPRPAQPYRRSRRASRAPSASPPRSAPPPPSVRA